MICRRKGLSPLSLEDFLPQRAPDKDGGAATDHGQQGVTKEFYHAVRPKYCLWTTPRWLWENDSGNGKGSGPWQTLVVRAWMERFEIERHYLMADGLCVIR